MGTKGKEGGGCRGRVRAGQGKKGGEKGEGG